MAAVRQSLGAHLVPAAARLALVALALTVTAAILPLQVGAAPPSDLQDQQRTTRPPESILGKTYQQWSAEWWQWVFSIPAANHPVCEAPEERTETCIFHPLDASGSQTENPVQRVLAPSGAILDVIGPASTPTPATGVQRVQAPTGAVLDVVGPVATPTPGALSTSDPVAIRRALGGKDCAPSSTGGVWFIGASLIENVVGNDVASHECTVPHGTRFFFPVVAWEADGVGSAPPATVPALRDLAASRLSRAQALHAQIDGQDIANVSLTGAYRTRSNAFSYRYPADSILCVLRTCNSVTYALNGGSVPTAIADGVYVMTTALGVGDHTIRVRGELPATGRRIDALYQISVQPR